MSKTIITSVTEILNDENKLKNQDKENKQVKNKIKVSSKKSNPNEAKNKNKREEKKPAFVKISAKDSNSYYDPVYSHSVYDRYNHSSNPSNYGYYSTYRPNEYQYNDRLADRSIYRPSSPYYPQQPYQPIQQQYQQQYQQPYQQPYQPQSYQQPQQTYSSYQQYYGPPILSYGAQSNPNNPYQTIFSPTSMYPLTSQPNKDTIVTKISQLFKRNKNNTDLVKVKNKRFMVRPFSAYNRYF